MAAALLVLALPMRRLYRMILILLAVLIVAGGAVYIKVAGRGFASMEERVSYLNTSARMLAGKTAGRLRLGRLFLPPHAAQNHRFGRIRARSA